MNLRRFCMLLGVAVLATSTANATVRTVHPGQSIQAAIDAASPGDTILVEPGIYKETGNTDYGLRITTDNIRLIGKTSKGGHGKGHGNELGNVQGNGNDDGHDNGHDNGHGNGHDNGHGNGNGNGNGNGHDKADTVRLIHYGTQKIGVYAAPADCGPEIGVGGCASELQGFYIRGFSVEDFPSNGIQTRFVDGFEIVENASVRNLNNGIYPTISANGLVMDNVSYGSLDTSLWVAASENVRVIGNNLYGSPIGFEITVSNNVLATHNDVHDNTVGFGLFHPNAAGNNPLPVMANWVIEQNNVYNNNRPNPAPPGSFQAGLPQGVGIILLGVSDNVISKNDVTGNDFAGIAVMGWCTATSLGDPNRDCDHAPPIRDPSASNNLVSLNKLSGNGGSPPPIGLPGVDILYVQYEPASGNCFEKNKPKNFTYYSSEPDGQLPTDGCKKNGPKK